MIKIYALKNLVSGFAYIGCTKYKLSKRMREHRCLLKANKHAEPLLQEAWNLLGESWFSIVELELLPSDASVIQKRERELHWMKVYSDYGLLFNSNRNSFQPTKKAIEKAQAVYSNKGRKQSAEEIQKRRLAQLGKPKNNGTKISETKKRLGQKPSAEAARLGGIMACKKRYAKD